MKHLIVTAACLATLMLTISTSAVEPMPRATPEGEGGGIEWVRQTLESGVDGAQMTPTFWSEMNGSSGSGGGVVTLLPPQDRDTGRSRRSDAPTPVTVQGAWQIDLSTRASMTPTAPAAAEGSSMEEVIAVGVRRRQPPQWESAFEEPENDWHRREGTMRSDTGRISVGRAVVYEDLSERRQFERHRDGYREARPQRSVSVGVLGARRQAN